MTVSGKLFRGAESGDRTSTFVLPVGGYGGRYTTETSSHALGGHVMVPAVMGETNNSGVNAWL